jgi:hypothetical protein
MLELRVSRRDWLHGEAKCPSCGLPLDKDRDIATRRAVPAPGFLVKHTRCGAMFIMLFPDERRG